MPAAHPYVRKDTMTNQKTNFKRSAVFLILSLLLIIPFSYAVYIEGFNQMRYGEDLSLNGSNIKLITANTTRLFIANDGKVGIGTITPDSAFKTVGDVNVTGSIWSQGINLTALIVSGGGWVDDGSMIRLTTSSDNVAIGATSTGSKLHVEGNVSVAGNLITGGHILGPESFGSDISNSFGWTKSSSIVSLADPNDKVGIGTNSPFHKLHVVGHINVTGVTSNSTFEGDVRIKGTLYGGSPLKIAGGLNLTEGNITFPDGSIADVGIPAGAIMQFAGNNTPAGWLPCDGSAVSRTQYARLFASISDMYGKGDGSTTFNVPDVRGRVLIANGTSSNDENGRSYSFRLNQTGGGYNRTLSAAQMPSHTHAVDPAATASGTESVDHTHATDPASTSVSVNDPGHTHTHPYGQMVAERGSNGVGTYDGAAAILDRANLNSATTGITATVDIASTASGGASASHTHTTDIASTTSASSGSDAPHPIMDPFLVVNCIIKT